TDRQVDTSGERAETSRGKATMFQGFKQFILRGNVVDLAVAVIIGAAFGAIVTALVDHIINPLIGAFVPTGDLASWSITIPGIVSDAQLGIGGIISAVINFLRSEEHTS